LVAGRRPENAAMLAPENAQHVGARAHQEDAFAFSDLADAKFVAHGGAMCVVCDGMGGLAAGAAASRAAVSAFLGRYVSKPPNETIPVALRESLTAANEAVLALSAIEGDCGSTLAAVVVSGNTMHWVSVGDTRILLLRDGRLFRVNREHRYQVELRRECAHGDGIAPFPPDDDPRGDQLTSSLGEAPPGAIDISVRGLRWHPGDSVFVVSDGLYRTLDHGALGELARESGPEICTAWVQAAIAAQRPDQDNVTAIGLRDRRAVPVGRADALLHAAGRIGARVQAVIASLRRQPSIATVTVIAILLVVMLLVASKASQAAAVESAERPGAQPGFAR